jgi:polyhydroxyalkanoate synthase
MNQPVAPDPADLARIFGEVAMHSSHILGDFLRRQAAHPETGKAALPDEFGIAKAYMDLAANMFANPYQLAAVQINMLWDYMSLWQVSMARLAGASPAPVAAPALGDNRFRDEDWQNHFIFDYIKQSYLITARHIQDAVAQTDGLSEVSRKKVNFFTRQYIDAMSPSNFALTNPQVLRETVHSGGKNLLQGLDNLLGDIERGHGELRISMTDPNAFKVGVNVATSPGKVVFQNDLMQLIQYEPSTAKVLKRPLLIVPPWINKYYILDLREKNSFIRWAVSQGHTVFVISWVNPDAKFAAKSFEDYMTEGPLAALSAIEQATGERQVNVIGYCLGGTLLGATLAYMAAKKDKRISAATFFVSLLDFSIPGELGVFIDEEQVEALERRMSERGYLEGAEMAATFNLLRANDLVWSFVVHNYLLGKEPFPFDLLYWNSDSTRMPAAMHSFYLRNMYLNNLLREPGGISLCGVPLDLRKIKVPAYFVSTAEDHIAPWKSSYRGAHILAQAGDNTRFVLGGSGHIAGIVNPPAANKYGYWTHDALPDSPDEWMAQAEQHDGSWWADWQQWIVLHGGGTVPARKPGDGALTIIEDAPGTYVGVRADA